MICLQSTTSKAMERNVLVRRGYLCAPPNMELPPLPPPKHQAQQPIHELNASSNKITLGWAHIYFEGDRLVVMPNAIFGATNPIIDMVPNRFIA